MLPHPGGYVSEALKHLARASFQSVHLRCFMSSSNNPMRLQRRESLLSLRDKERKARTPCSSKLSHTATGGKVKTQISGLTLSLWDLFYYARLSLVWGMSEENAMATPGKPNGGVPRHCGCYWGTILRMLMTRPNIFSSILSYRWLS